MIKAGGHLIRHRSCKQSSRSDISGLFPYREPATQVFPHLRTHPLGFLKLCLAEKTHPLESRVEGTDPSVREEVLHWGWPWPLFQGNWVTSPLTPPHPQMLRQQQKNEARLPLEATINLVFTVSKTCLATPDRNLGGFLVWFCFSFFKGKSF